MCKECHRRFHNDYEFNLMYKVIFQKKFLESNTTEDFIKIFGQDYIFKQEKGNKN